MATPLHKQASPEVVTPFGPFLDISSWNPVVLGAVLGLIVLVLVKSLTRGQSKVPQSPKKPQSPQSVTSSAPVGMMTTDSGPTQPPGDKEFTAAELARYDGTNAELPVYLAVKGTVFDVTKNRDMYSPGKGYHVFAGKDASQALGKSSLKPEECVPDYSSLTAEEMETLNKWEAHYKKKYNIVGKVVD
ncbi:uncharacterized protein SPPG_08863 [Spizellomyces punctatus DAOM BR117]|uniref:Cytochrome b5 heme-binding domain-containing protein n=1 Tax=Spizellomyces punctatus (strain DAOM BR117) TaxID=645134 RepID=A0A0L0HVM5_SPIPD|nr:uncharacterized protein SPPG_08863 [Spizellomyces punctatus DAOM BR117]KND04955.1 hypothetical protein SPPG_08863 [Spizellomyces punctatus DAOM BR117]|eukprot:XP_016612994.1 hypothetical protein SPPG_08863 [Spizellomyces punctatus DAOM BR117]